MKTLRYMERANLGNYSHREIEVTEAVEDDAIDEAIVTVGHKVRWHLGQPERQKQEAIYLKYKDALKRLPDDPTQEQIDKWAKIVAFVVEYEKDKAEIEG